jgi:hypothetical protein
MLRVITVRRAFDMKSENKLTDDQIKIVDEVAEQVDGAFDGARQRLNTARIGDGDGGSGPRCFVCSCPAYEFPAQGRPLLRCGNSDCGHSFTRHDVY